MSHRPEHSICISLVHEALQSAKAQGLDTTLLLQRANIAVELLALPQARVAIANYAQLWIAIADAMNDEFFGLDRRALKRGSFQLLTKWLIHCKTIQHAIEETLQFFNVCFEDLYGELRLVQNSAQIVIVDQHQRQSMFTYACYWMLIHSLLCWLSGQRIVLNWMSVQSSMPLAHADYQTRFCSDIRYESAENILSLSLDYLSLPIKQDAHSRDQFLQATPANLLVRFTNPAALSQQIRKKFLHTAPQYWLEFRALAHALHMSEATLQRRLRAEGISYQQLKNEIRCERAILLLKQPDLSLQQISEQLNFHDPSAFYRAFKKWTGLKPSYYRSEKFK